MAYFRSRPKTIRAERCDVLILKSVEEPENLPSWFALACTNNEVDINSVGIRIKTLEGTMLANPDDYIICGTQDELYPCKPDIFRVSYEWLMEE